MDLTEQSIEKLLATGRAQYPITDTGAEVFTISPAGAIVKLTDQYPPKRIRQKVCFTDVASFIRYVNTFKVGQSTMFAKVETDGATLCAILDYHIPTSAPDACSHLAYLELETTPEWDVWRDNDRTDLDQVAFATWMEDNRALFSSPEGSGMPSWTELDEMVRTIHAHRNARFIGSSRLDNGAYSVNFEEDISVQGMSSVKGGVMDFPKAIMGGFAIFEGSAAYAVPARFKTRTKERGLTIRYETENVIRLVRNAVKDVLELVAKETGIQPLIGRTGGLNNS